MPAQSHGELARLMKLLAHYRMYPDDDWTRFCEQQMPGDKRMHALFREYLFNWRKR